MNAIYLPKAELVKIKIVDSFGFVFIQRKDFSLLHVPSYDLHILKDKEAAK